jgi:hypothetical protein
MAARRDGDGDEMREARAALLNLRRTPVRAVVCGASGARASALGQGEGRARREGLPQAPLRVQQACPLQGRRVCASAGMPRLADPARRLVMYASDRAHREAGDGAVPLSRESPL